MRRGYEHRTSTREAQGGQGQRAWDGGRDCRLRGRRRICAENTQSRPPTWASPSSCRLLGTIIRADAPKIMRYVVARLSDVRGEPRGLALSCAGPRPNPRSGADGQAKRRGSGGYGARTRVVHHCASRPPSRVGQTASRHCTRKHCGPAETMSALFGAGVGGCNRTIPIVHKACIRISIHSFALFWRHIVAWKLAQWSDYPFVFTEIGLVIRRCHHYRHASANLQRRARHWLV